MPADKSQRTKAKELLVCGLNTAISDANGIKMDSMDFHILKASMNSKVQIKACEWYWYIINVLYVPEDVMIMVFDIWRSLV